MAMNHEYITNIETIFTSYMGILAEGNEGVLNVKGIQENLEQIFPGKTCVEVLYTRNTDKMFYGVLVSPTILADDLVNILYGDDNYEVSRYSVEIDSKLFDVGLDASEATAYLLAEISAMISSPAPAWEVRSIIDSHMAEEDDVIQVKQSINYSQVLILAIKDAMVKMSSVRFKDTDGILSNEFINSNEIRDSLLSALNKIRSSVFGVGTAVKEPNLVLLAWAFDIYHDAKHQANSAIDCLEKSKRFTGSRLQIAEFDKTIKSLQRLNFDITNESARVLNEAKKNGLLSGLKKSGLRSLEDDLYEFSIRAKNAETEEEAYYALRQINTRLNILEEYIYENEDSMSQVELDKWMAVAKKYRELREILAQKKIHKKSYGLWYDYDKLDELDS